MRTVRVLIGNPERRVAGLIESLVRKTCADRALVDIVRTARVDEFVHAASDHEFDLIIVNPETILPVQGREANRLAIGEALSALRIVKSMRRAPLFAVAVSDKNQVAFAEAGANVVLPLPFKCQELQDAIASFLILPPQPESRLVDRTSLWDLLVRNWQRGAAS